MVTSEIISRYPHGWYMINSWDFFLDLGPRRGSGLFLWSWSYCAACLHRKKRQTSWGRGEPTSYKTRWAFGNDQEGWRDSNIVYLIFPWIIPFLGSRPPSKDSGKDGEPVPGRAGTAGGKNPKSKSKKGKDNSPAHSRPGSSMVRLMLSTLWYVSNSCTLHLIRLLFTP